MVSVKMPRCISPEIAIAVALQNFTLEIFRRAEQLYVGAFNQEKVSVIHFRCFAFREPVLFGVIAMDAAARPETVQLRGRKEAEAVSAQIATNR